MISNEKKALLHVGKQKLGLSDAEYRHVLQEHTGKISSADPDFTDEDFKKVIDHLKALGFWVKRNWEQTRPRDAGDLPTREQLKVIQHLREDLAQYYAPIREAKVWQGFLEKRIRISPLGPQTRAQANHLIEVLKQRVAREMKKVVAGGGA